MLSKAATETIAQAFSIWRSEGRLFRVGEDKCLSVGGLRGIMIVETDKGELNTANIVCPAMREFRFEDAHMIGEGL